MLPLLIYVNVLVEPKMLKFDMLQSVYHRLDGRYGNCTTSNHNDDNIYHDKYQVSLTLQSSLLKKVELAITLMFIEK